MNGKEVKVVLYFLSNEIILVTSNSPVARTIFSTFWAVDKFL